MAARGWRITAGGVIAAAAAVMVIAHVTLVQAVLSAPVAIAAPAAEYPGGGGGANEPFLATAPAPMGGARCGVLHSAQTAVDVATAAGETSAVAVLDKVTGVLTSAGQDAATFNSASVVKVLMAIELLATGQMTGDTADAATLMITQSDDDAADGVYQQAGDDDVVNLVAQRYKIANLGSPPMEAGQWGETQVTARGLAQLYAAVQDDPVVWPWLSAALANMTRTAADGTDQGFGIPSVASNWGVKQGWMVGLGDGSTYSSTGYVDHNRWVVVLLSAGDASQYGLPMTTTMTSMAAALLPDGVAPGVAC